MTPELRDQLLDEVERLRGMIRYALNAPTLDSAKHVLLDALAGGGGAESVRVGPCGMPFHSNDCTCGGAGGAR